MNRTMVIGLSVLLCLYLAFGLMGCASAAWVMRDEADKVVNSYDAEADCKADIPGARTDWTCTSERIVAMPAAPYLLECDLSFDAGHHMHGCGGRWSLEECETDGRAGVKSGEFVRYSCEPTGVTQELIWSGGHIPTTQTRKSIHFASTAI